MVLAAESVAQNISFAIIAVMMVGAALRVVTTKNVVHAALWLVVVLSGAAAIYILLAAEFVAVTQVLVYIGAVMVLFLFGTMLTRAQVGKSTDTDNANRAPAVLVAALLLGTVGYVVVDAFSDERLPTGVVPVPTSDVSDTLFSTYSIPFWALSILLTAAAIGAIVLARRD